MLLICDVTLNSILRYMSDAFAKIGFAPQCGCSPSFLQRREELAEPVRSKALELLHDMRRVKDLSGMYKHMDVVGHDLHRSDGNAEGVAFVADEAIEGMFNFSINQFLFVFRAPYQVEVDIVHAMC